MNLLRLLSSFIRPVVLSDDLRIYSLIAKRMKVYDGRSDVSSQLLNCQRVYDFIFSGLIDERINEFAEHVTTRKPYYATLIDHLREEKKRIDDKALENLNCDAKQLA